jgi:hypothetical protein
LLMLLPALDPLSVYRDSVSGDLLGIAGIRNPVSDDLFVLVISGDLLVLLTETSGAPSTLSALTPPSRPAARTPPPPTPSPAAPPLPASASSTDSAAAAVAAAAAAAASAAAAAAAAAATVSSQHISMGKKSAGPRNWWIHLAVATQISYHSDYLAVVV